MVVDKSGYRLNVGIVMVNDQGQVFWGKRLGQDAWQFPQGGVGDRESLKKALYRELKEETGLSPDDIDILGVTQRWYRYKLPRQYIRQGTKPLVIGQKQKWFLVKLTASEQKVQLAQSTTPEFDSWRWLDYWQAPEQVIFFKRQVYRLALKSLESLLVCKKP